MQSQSHNLLEEALNLADSNTNTIRRNNANEMRMEIFQQSDRNNDCGISHNLVTKEKINSDVETASITEVKEGSEGNPIRVLIENNVKSFKEALSGDKGKQVLAEGLVSRPLKVLLSRGTREEIWL